MLEDTDFTVPLTATNNDGSVNGSITISVQQIDPTPVFTTPVSVHEVNEGGTSTVDLSGDLQHTESLAYQSGYSAPSWLTISGLTLVITNAQQVSARHRFRCIVGGRKHKDSSDSGQNRNDTGSGCRSSTAPSHRCGIRHFRESE